MGLSMMEFVLLSWQRHLTMDHQTDIWHSHWRCLLSRNVSMKAMERTWLKGFSVHLQHSGIICMSVNYYIRLGLLTWDRDGEKYAGEYTCSEETGEVKGSPAHASNVKAVVHSIKTRQKSKGASATQNHAEAMTLEELQRLMEWSTQECPNEWLTNDKWRSEAYDAVAALKHRLQHGFMRGFMSSAFTLWTRSVIKRNSKWTNGS